MGLQTGVYSPDNQVRVTVWPEPDVNGTGNPATVESEDPVTGQVVYDYKTENGQMVREYPVPDGFGLIPTRSPGADNAQGAHVRVDARGNPIRNKDGHAIGIKPGCVLLEYPDSSFHLLETAREKAIFERSHSLVSAPQAPAPAPTSGPVPLDSARTWQ